jgi:hypothetical protein
MNKRRKLTVSPEARVQQTAGRLGDIVGPQVISLMEL